MNMAHLDAIKLAGGMIYTIVLELTERKNEPTSPETLADGVVRKALAVGGYDSVPPQFRTALLESTIPTGVKLKVFCRGADGLIWLGPEGWSLVSVAVVEKLGSLSGNVLWDFQRG